MLWSVMRIIFKTSSVTPDIFYVFNMILSFSNCSQRFKKNLYVENFGRERPWKHLKPGSGAHYNLFNSVHIMVTGGKKINKQTNKI